MVTRFLVNIYTSFAYKNVLEELSSMCVMFDSRLLNGQWTVDVVLVQLS